MGTSLFELYLVLRKFVKVGEALCPSDNHDFVTYSSYEWFTPGVMHWLDISVYKAMSRIEKAIDLDKLVPIDETVKYSSSAVDTLAIFNQIKIFWEQLGWPDIEGAYALIAKIVNVSFLVLKIVKNIEQIYKISGYLSLLCFLLRSHGFESGKDAFRGK